MFTKLATIVLIISLLISRPIQEEQTGVLNGRVIGPGREPLENATVVLQPAGAGRKRVAGTLEDGSFSIAGIQPVEHRLWISKEGYEVYSQQLDFGSASSDTLECQLNPLTDSSDPPVPESEQRRFDEGTLMFQRGSVKEAKAIFEDFLSAYPFAIKAHYNLGLCKMEVGFMERHKGNWENFRALEEAALDDFAITLERYPDFIGALVASATCRISLLEQSAASEEYSRLVKLRPNDPILWYTYGETLIHKRELAEAASAFRTAIRLRPEFADAHAKLGAALMHLGDLEGAIKHLENYLRLEPDSDMSPYAKELLEDCRKKLGGETKRP